MSDKSPNPYHPAITVTKIRNFIPIILESDKSQYNTWSELFQIHCRAYDVIDHIIPTETTSTESTTSTIYSTISHDLLNTIITKNTTAQKAWERLRTIFQDDEHSRALYLNAQFTNLRMENFPNMSAYCQELKNLSDQLSNVGETVNNSRLVLQLIAGLHDSYDSVSSQIAHAKVLPDFYEARSMVILEETRKQKQASHLSEAALITTTTSGSNKQLGSSNSPNNPRSTQTNSSNYRGCGGGRGSGYRGRGGCGRGKQSCNNFSQPWYASGFQSHPWHNSQPWNSSNSAQYANWAWKPWSIPPCPYPSSSWVKPHQPTAGPGILGPRPNQTQSTMASQNNFAPTDIDAAFHTLSLYPPDDNWYMVGIWIQVPPRIWLPL
ncbi:uncharacterized protein [Rutidosis leptorrhynchoides]|uniref:uncharacterized protein n=1 Tax=Rutidosis leptorrhynchoides TaxID=125765 RepID=UPI003A9A26B0